MAQIKWKKKADIEQEKLEREQKKAEKEKFKNKKFTTLSSKEKDILLEQIAKDLGYLKKECTNCGGQGIDPNDDGTGTMMCEICGGMGEI